MKLFKKKSLNEKNKKAFCKAIEKQEKIFQKIEKQYNELNKRFT